MPEAHDLPAESSSFKKIRSKVWYITSTKTIERRELNSVFELQIYGECGPRVEIVDVGEGASGWTAASVLVTPINLQREEILHFALQCVRIPN